MSKFETTPTLNVPHIREVIAAIKGRTVPHLGFHMESWASDEAIDEDGKDPSGHICETTACMAGWSVAVKTQCSTDYLMMLATKGQVQAMARENMGLSYEQSDMLFTYNTNATDKEAIAALEHLIETGKVIWDPSDE